MKFASTLITLGLAVSAVVAEPIPNAFQKRDLACYTTIIGAISTQLGTCKSLTDAWTGVPCPNAAITNCLDDLCDLINGSVDPVLLCDPMTIPEGLALVPYIEALIAQTHDAVQAAIDKKTLCPAMCAAVRAAFICQKAAAVELAGALTSQAPPELADIAAELTAGILDEIQRGIDAFVC